MKTPAGTCGRFSMSRHAAAAASHAVARQALFWLILWPIISAMTDTSTLPPLPDRLSIDPASPHFNAAVFERDVGIKFNDRERTNVAEYCISEGWIKVPAGKALDRKGNPLLTKLKGKVEAFYR